VEEKTPEVDIVKEVLIGQVVQMSQSLLQDLRLLATDVWDGVFGFFLLFSVAMMCDAAVCLWSENVLHTVFCAAGILA
jgi:hypothetical protein